MDLLPNPKLMDLWCQTRSPNATHYNQLAHFCPHKTAQTDPKEHNITFEVSLFATLTRNRYRVVYRGCFFFVLFSFLFWRYDRQELTPWTMLTSVLIWDLDAATVRAVMMVAYLIV